LIKGVSTRKFGSRGYAIMSTEPPGGNDQGWVILILPQVAHSARFSVGYPWRSFIGQPGFPNKN
jgi:hypothetical protein